MKVAVLGANGFIGRSVAARFIEDGHDVIAIYNNNTTLIPKGCSLYAVNNLPQFAIDCLVVCIGNHSLKHREYVEQFVLLKQIFENLNFKRIILTSSTTVYGNHDDTITINSSFNQPSTYGLSKITQEFLVKSYSDYAIVRPTYIYGTGMSENSLIPIWYKNAIKNAEISVFGNGERTQDYLHINDLTDLCVLVAKSNLTNSEVIAATGKSTSNSYLANLISKAVGSTVKFVGQDSAASSKFDISKTSELFGWYPSVSIEEGINQYISHENTNL